MKKTIVRYIRNIMLAALSLLVAWSIARAMPTAGRAWPEVALPPDAASYEIGEQINMDGVPTRMRGFDTTASPEQTAAWFRQHLARPVVENKVGAALVLGRELNGYYVTVQLSPAEEGSGTRGVTAVADVVTGLAQAATTRAANERLLANLPTGTELVSTMTSVDERRNARFIMLTNRYSEEVNRERVRELMRQDGMELEREARAADAGADVLATLPPAAAGGMALFFRGQGREAIAVISRLPDSRASIVMNTVTTMENYR
jgi:hypothetical protein